MKKKTLTVQNDMSMVVRIAKTMIVHIEIVNGRTLMILDDITRALIILIIVFLLLGWQWEMKDEEYPF